MTEESAAMNAEPSITDRSVGSERVRDVSGSGKWDGKTGRYIPVSGGSRTRVPITDDPEVPRYAGMVGIDPDQGDGIRTMSALYSHLGGMPVVKGGKAARFLGELLERKPVIKEEDDEFAL